MGRSLTPAQLTTGLEELYRRIERPILKIIRAVETEITTSAAVLSFAVELSWIDRQTGEERLVGGLMTLDLRRESDQAREARGAWAVTGFTVSGAPERQPERQELSVEGHGTGPARAINRANLLSFWD